MDDMDAEAEELGGKRTFFAGSYARYGWAKLMAPSLGGFEVLALYSEAIATMGQNPGVPELFRDIFKNAYLPYRDPETLKSFLKEINHFSYDHSERLGDAFEYLLSVLGSQGDAGQFRTPRHIIDFMVEVMDPQKHESVLDPACGTAGFLISAWKHILKNNSSPRNTDEGKSSKTLKPVRPELVEGLPGNLLTPDERARLAANIRGYDISPDMVRLSLVNLYLHGFSDPHVVEYDTLTQDDKWNEVADVILANPPFMSPKGGIKPHKRFSVQATRSEVLFVDYMAEHLSATGRAAIVVPEGIIFQSGTAYKALRKMLVDTSLVAVVSLPAGVFNPYSGVKTSILILDKRVHKQTDSVLFVKVQNDGFNLGAQRRAVVNSDLPEATRLLRGWMTVQDKFEGDGVMAQAVARGRIGESGDFNLSGERYVATPASISNFDQIAIGDVVTTVTAPVKIQRVEYADTGRYPIIDQSQDSIAGWTDDESAIVRIPKQLVIFGDHTCAVKLIDQPFAQGADGIKILQTEDSLLPKFLYFFLKCNPLEADGYKRHFGDLKRKVIPLPPLEVQHQIVTEIEGYQKIIDGARQVLDNYKPHIVVSPDWPVVDLKDVSEVTSSKRILAEEYVSTGAPFYRTKEIVELSKGKDISLELFIAPDRFQSIKARFGAPAKGELLISAVGTIGVSWVVEDDREFYFKDGNLLWVKNLANLDPYFLKYCLDSTFSAGIDHIVFGAAYKALTIEKLKEFKIPLPDIETQRTIVAEIEAEQALVAANRELIRRMEAKVKAAIDRVWGQA
ncbi:N-6 DNA methylase [Rhodoferax sp.]|uniref:N-6 DNA methylase n=1 Tax=Rhodoferax sp. TaxID=50421 RepID=UPI002ACE624C|nr:N-6 DNA methylase [Rhodoferax sp.]MDZ7919324.1 N-6 DNA methylase [Rhodoferax sp.]